MNRQLSVTIVDSSDSRRLLPIIAFLAINDPCISKAHQRRAADPLDRWPRQPLKPLARRLSTAEEFKDAIPTRLAAKIGNVVKSYAHRRPARQFTRFVFSLEVHSPLRPR